VKKRFAYVRVKDKKILESKWKKNVCSHLLSSSSAVLYVLLLLMMMMTMMTMASLADNCSRQAGVWAR